MYDVIIIGADPAGMTAAIYAKRAGKSVLVLEGASYGGQIINTPSVDNYPVAPHVNGFDFATKIYEQAKELGAEFIFEKVVLIKTEGDIKTVVTNTHEYRAKAVIIATGSENRKLGVERENELVGRGVSYCATCDGAFYRKKTVAVVGGGNTALEDALYLSDIAETVYLIHRREGFRAEDSTVKKLKEKQNVKFILNAKVTRLIAEKRLSAIEITYNDGKKEELTLNGLFVAVGRIPENQNFASVIDLDDSGYAIAGENCKTKTAGIFVAGDCRVKDVRQLVTATSDGAIAATNAVKYINEL